MKYLLALLLVLPALPAFAQVEELGARVGTVTCSACFNIAMVSLKQLDGVSDVAGDMNEGWIRVTVNQKHGISIKDAIDRVRVAGFKDNAQFTMTASGMVEQRGNKMVLVIPNQRETILLDPADREQMAANAAASKSPLRATGPISGNGNQYELKVQKLQKQ